MRETVINKNWDEDRAGLLISEYTNIKGGLLEALHALQAEFDHVPAAALELLADAFNLSRAEVHGVISFYHDFHTSAKGKCHVRICQAEACQAMGSRRLTKHVEKFLGLEMGQTSDNGAYTLETVYCFGNCATSPNVEIDGQLYGRVDNQKFDALLGAKS